MKKSLLFLFALWTFSSSVFASNTEEFMEYSADATLDYRIVTDHFFVDFSQKIANSTDDDGDGFANVVESSVEALEEAYDALIDQMGYDYPFDDSVRIQVYLDDTGDKLPEGAVGVFQVLETGEMFLAANPYANEDVLKVTMVHEFFHLVQYFIDSDFLLYGHGVGLGESTAVWVEDEVYDNVNDYVNYLPDLFAYPDYSIFASVYPEDSLFQYGLALWPKFVSELMGPDSIREIWENFGDSTLHANSPFKIYQAYKDYFEAQGENLASAYILYAIANLDRSLYEEGDLYRGELAMEEGVLGSIAMPAMSYAPAPYGANYLEFLNEEDKDWFYFNFNRIITTDYSIALVPVSGSQPDASKAQIYFVEHDTMWEGAVYENAGDYSSFVAILVPLEDVNMYEQEDPYFDEAQPYEYFAEYYATETALETFLETLSLGDEALESEEVEKEGEEPSLEPVASALSLNLSVMNLTQDSVQMKWTKPQEKDFDYYLTIDHDGEFVDALTLSNKNQRSYYYAFPVKSGNYLFTLQVMVDGEMIQESSLEVIVPEGNAFSDIVEGTEWAEAVAYLKARNMVQGYPDGTFKPEKDINRAEFLKLVVLSAYDGELEAGSACFTDVDASAWYAPYVCTAKAENWIQGYADGTFKPEQTINFVEAIKILLEVQGVVYGEATTGDWYQPYLDAMFRLGLLKKNEELALDQNQTRGDFALLLYRYLSL